MQQFMFRGGAPVVPTASTSSANQVDDENEQQADEVDNEPVQIESDDEADVEEIEETEETEVQDDLLPSAESSFAADESDVLLFQQRQAQAARRARAQGLILHDDQTQPFDDVDDVDDEPQLSAVKAARLSQSIGQRLGADGDAADEQVIQRELLHVPDLDQQPRDDVDGDGDGQVRPGNDDDEDDSEVDDDVVVDEGARDREEAYMSE
jgi:hypothetical protein